MDTTIEKDTETRQRVTVSVSAADIVKKETKILGEFTRQASIPGFRPGKAPVAMVKKRHAGKVADELKRELISNAYKELQENKDLNIYTVLNIEPGDISSETDASIVFTVDLQPDFELPKYKELAIHKHPEEVSDEEITEAIDRIRQQRAEFKAADREARKGDYVKLSYEGTMDGQSIAEIVPESPIYGTQKITWEEAGAEDAPGIRAIINGIIDMKAGDKKEVTEAFPKDFEIKALAGKTGTYAVEVSEVREKILPELDEAFFKSLEVESLEALQEKAKTEIGNHKEEDGILHMREQILEALNNSIEFPIPESAIEQEMEQLLAQYIQRQLQMGIPREDLEKHRDELFSGARVAAEKQVKSNFILGKIAENEKIELKNDDIHQRIIQEAIATQTPPDKLVKELQNDQTRLDEIRRTVLFNKTLDFLVDSANVTVQKECTHEHKH